MAAPVPDFTPFVVFGSSKSGTTWLQRMLDSHPEVRCHFQVPIFPLKDAFLWLSWRRYRVGRSSPFKGVFEDDVAEQRYRQKHDLFYNMDILQPGYYERVARGNRVPVDPEVRDTHMRVVRGLMESALKDNPEKRIFGSKSYTNLELYFDVFPQGKVVHIVRDGRDVCVSKRFHFLRMGIYFPGEERSPVLKGLVRLPLGQRIALSLQSRFGVFDASDFVRPGTDGPLFTADSLTKLATEWERVTRYILRYQEQFPECFCVLKYEELKERPVEGFQKVCEFLGADTGLPLIERIVEQHSFKRMKKGKDAFFRKGATGDWRNHFRAQDVALFKSITGDLLVDLGYEESDAWQAAR